MTHQTLLTSPQRRPQETKEQASPRTPQRAKAPVSHRRPRNHSAGKDHTKSGGWQWPVVGLVVAFVLSLLAGVLLGVHGPSGAPSADRPAITLQPGSPAEPESVQGVPAPGPVKPSQKPTGPGTGQAKPEGVKKVTLRPGDTLWALARTHGTTVKSLQQLNDLGRSTLIYAGKTLHVPALPGSPDAARQSTAAPPTAAPPTATPKPAVKSPAKSAPNAVIAYARAQLGKPYIWGGTGPRGFDCSGLVMRAWQKAGVKLPRTTWGQINAGTATTRARLVPGDLVLSYGGGHVGLYLGDGKVIHAPRPGRTVTIAPLPDPSDVVGYRHVTR
ncbi:NlpC/P60 family protein [Streptomyces sp. NPDC058914]|uniref:NlpC/P60 family protein n=1 Tax=Streptomyces sp. NPDC058914 TaxID=3346671 RepID=UPI0036B91FC4